MVKKFFWLILFLAILVILSLGLGILGRSPGEWICEDGQWVKLGNPRQSKPSLPCYKEANSEQKVASRSAEPSVGTPWQGIGFGEDNQSLMPADYQPASPSASASGQPSRKR